MKTEHAELITRAIRATGYRAFERYTYRSEKTNAQQNLSGRTHYVDDDTLRYFGARIAETATAAWGAAFIMRESVTPPGCGRVSRIVVFDFTGNVIFRSSDRADNNDKWLSPARAKREFKRIAEVCELFALTIAREACARELGKARRALQDAEDALAIIN